MKKTDQSKRKHAHGERPFEVGEFKEVKELYRDTDLRQPVVVVADPSYDLAPLLSGLDQAELVPADQVDWHTLTTPLVAIGRIFDNPILMKLANRRRVFFNDRYPGKDGYVIQTIHNPDNIGRNIVAIGLSRAADSETAIKAFLKLIEKRDHMLDFTVSIKSEHPFNMKITDTEFEKKNAELVQRMDREYSHVVALQACVCGLLRMLSGDPKWGIMFKNCILRYIKIAKQRRDWAIAPATIPKFWLDKVTVVFDALEEDDAVWNDTERLEITNYIWGMMQRAKLDFREYSGWLPETMEPDEMLGHQRQFSNHQTFATMSLYVSMKYLRDYYGVKGFEEWLPILHKTMQLHAGSGRFENAIAYDMLTPGQIIEYENRVGMNSFSRKGYLREFLDHTVVVSDNRSCPVTYGDCSPSKLASLGSWHTPFFSAGAHYYQDKSFKWICDWLTANDGGTTQPTIHAFTHLSMGDYYDSSVVGECPEQYTGITAIHTTAHSYARILEMHGFAWSRAQRVTSSERRRIQAEEFTSSSLTVPAEGCVDKVSMRNGFGRNDEYLLLCGTAGFNHLHEDMNSISRITWNDRMFILEGGYCNGRAMYHNALLIRYNNEMKAKPLSCRLNLSYENEHIGFTQTELERDNVADWRRNICWLKGTAFIVYDEINALAAGDFRLDCIWQTLGSTSLDDESVEINQNGELFHIQNLDGSEQNITEWKDLFFSKHCWNWYEHADGILKTITQTKKVCLNSNELEHVANILSPEKQKADRLTKDLYLVNDVLLGAAVASPIELENIFVSASFVIIARKTVVLAGLHALTVNGQGIRILSGCCSLVAENGKVKLTARTSIQAMLGGNVNIHGVSVASDNGIVELPAGEHDVDIAISSDNFGEIKEQHYQPATTGAGPRFSVVSYRMLQKSLEYESRISSFASDRDLVVTGQEHGILRAYNKDDILFEQRLETEITATHICRLSTGKSLILAGTDDGVLRAFDLNGNTVTEKTFCSIGIHSPSVSSILAADLDGNGTRTILVGTLSCWLAAFNEDWEELFKSIVRYHGVGGIDITWFGDIGEDGIIALATEYGGFNAFSRKGDLLYVCGGRIPRCILKSEMPDKTKGLVFGLQYGIAAHPADKGYPELWRANTGGETLDIKEIRSQIVSVNSIGLVTAHDKQGKKLWQTELGGKLLKIGSDERAITVFGEDDVVELTHTGELTRRFSLLHGIEKVFFSEERVYFTTGRKWGTLDGPDVMDRGSSPTS